MAIDKEIKKQEANLRLLYHKLGREQNPAKKAKLNKQFKDLYKKVGELHIKKQKKKQKRKDKKIKKLPGEPHKSNFAAIIIIIIVVAILVLFFLLGKI